MSYFFTDYFREALRTDQNVMDGRKVKIVLFRYAPAMGASNPAWLGSDTVAELLTSSAGWVEVDDIEGYPLALEIDIGTRTVGSSRYVMFSTYPFEGLGETVGVAAIGVVLVGDLGGVTYPLITDPLIFVTNTPLAEPNIKPGDTLTASPDGSFPDATNRWMFGWSTTAPDPNEGPLVIALGPPPFEVSGSQHAWLFPQRVNMIANPSFEAPGMDYWSANGALTRVEGGAPKGGAWAGQCAGNGSYAIMESNVFSTLLGETFNEQWTIQLMAKGTGRLKVGFVYWDADYRATACDWGVEEEWDLQEGAWIHVATHRHAPEAHLAMVRLELEGASLTIDKVLAEPGYLKDWLYFDGDERYGARDDFSWYGGYNRAGGSYSLWYNHRKAVVGRLFARTVDPNDPTANVTDEEMEEQGLVYRWVPAGISVVPHMDVLYPYDMQNPVPPKPPGVLPYWPDSPDGVVHPWLKDYSGRTTAYWDTRPGWDEGLWSP